jgi:hypothetical protein
MTSLFMAYLMVTGALANGIKVLRHVGKAGGRACEGDYREAGNEMLTAAVAPLDGVLFQSSLLVCEVLSAVQRSRKEELELELRRPLDGVNHCSPQNATR